MLDEFVVIPLCFLGLQKLLQSGIGWVVVIVGFVVFRIFDIAKPFGIKRLQDLPGGYGVVADDLAAAFLTSIVLHLLTVIAFYLGYLDKYIN